MANKRFNKINIMKNRKVIVEYNPNNNKDVAKKKEGKVIVDLGSDTAPEKVKILLLILF